VWQPFDDAGLDAVLKHLLAIAIAPRLLRAGTSFCSRLWRATSLLSVRSTHE
jgi:hypothetical protein